ncbi:MAG: 50S ribosomal protein L31 [Planctomycetes bacterium]|nr:50S ribosomal protein L31 [Planctomycetota bacterium]
MKKGIHPEYVEATVTCGCGESFKTRSTKSVIRVEICSKCHPFYTGKEKLVDSAGMVERFQRRYNWSERGKQKAAPSPDAPAASPVAPAPAPAETPAATPS